MHKLMVNAVAVWFRCYYWALANAIHTVFKPETASTMVPTSMAIATVDTAPTFHSRHHIWEG